MKVLYIKSNMHVKNHHALMNYKNIDFTIINSVNDFYKMENISSFDAVYSPCDPIDVSLYPSTKFVFGPHFSVFPEKNHMEMIEGNKNVLYIQPSDWVRNLWKFNPLCKNIRLETLPFGVDTEKFVPKKPILERDKVFIYFKNRNPLDLKLIETFLLVKNYDFIIFSYKNRYNEEEYIDYLQNSKFGIWIGGHESQGFALQEALSCNVPLLLWSVKSMNQEYGSNYNDISATTIPYWHEKCGEYFHNPTEIEEKYNKFINNLEKYKPREYILQNLSIDVCENRLINILYTF